MSIGTLLFRADASVTAGTGHVMRCLALAHAWQDSGGRAIFASRQITDALRKRLADDGCDVASISSPAGSSDDAAQTIAVARTQKCDWVVVDGYAFGSQYQQELKSAGLKVLFVDDYGHAPPYSAGVVLNQNVTALPELYSERNPQVRLLLGTRYCLLRREFVRWRNWQRKILPECGRLLVLMGGSDPENVTARVIEALAAHEFRGVAANVVVGSSNPHFASLANHASSWPNIILKRDVTGMAELMASADIAISASGATCWELCAMGLPSLLVDVADNQKAIAEELNRRGCAIHIGDSSITSASIAQGLKELIGSQQLRQSLSQRLRELVDGYGAERVVSVLRGTPNIRLRLVRPDDERLLWVWANDAEVRAASFSSEPIAWETHEKWFRKNSNSSQNLFLIAEDADGCALGQIRFDFEGRDAFLNFSIAKDKRGLGLAAPLVQAATSEVWSKTSSERVHAFVKPENKASARTFLKAGFTCAGFEEVRGNDAVHFFVVRS